MARLGEARTPGSLQKLARGEVLRVGPRSRRQSRLAGPPVNRLADCSPTSRLHRLSASPSLCPCFLENNSQAGVSVAPKVPRSPSDQADGLYGEGGVRGGNPS